jgi:hypothetical protein
MNSRDIEKYCGDLNAVLWDTNAADRLFLRAAGAVHKAAEGNLERDNIHTQPFTEKLMEHILGVRSSPKKKKKR